MVGCACVRVATKLITASVIYFVAVIIMAHFFAPVAYQWQFNTISDLAAQGLPPQWIMQIEIIGDWLGDGGTAVALHHHPLWIKIPANLRPAALTVVWRGQVFMRQTEAHLTPIEEKRSNHETTRTLGSD